MSYLSYIQKLLGDKDGLLCYNRLRTWHRIEVSRGSLLVESIDDDDDDDYLVFVRRTCPINVYVVVRIS